MGPIEVLQGLCKRLDSNDAYSILSRGLLSSCVVVAIHRIDIDNPVGSTLKS